MNRRTFVKVAAIAAAGALVPKVFARENELPYLDAPFHTRTPQGVPFVVDNSSRVLQGFPRDFHPPRGNKWIALGEVLVIVGQVKPAPMSQL